MKLTKEHFLEQDDGKVRDAMLFEGIEYIADKIDTCVKPKMDWKRIFKIGSVPAMAFSLVLILVHDPSSPIGKVVKALVGAIFG